MTGAEIKAFREKHGLKAKELAMMIGYSGMHISQIETGTKNSINVTYKIEALMKDERLFTEKMQEIEKYRHDIEFKKNQDDKKAVSEQLSPKKVTEFREKHGLTILDLSLMIDVSFSSVSNYEREKSKISKIPKKVQELMDDAELFAEKMQMIEERRTNPRKSIKHKNNTIGYIPDGKSFEDYNAKLLELSHKADKLGISYGEYMAIRRDARMRGVSI